MIVVSRGRPCSNRVALESSNAPDTNRPIGMRTTDLVPGQAVRRKRRPFPFFPKKHQKKRQHQPILSPQAHDELKPLLRRALVPTYDEVIERIQYVYGFLDHTPEDDVLNSYNKLNTLIATWQIVVAIVLMFFGTRRPDELSNLRFGLVQWHKTGGATPVDQLKIGVTSQKRRRKGLGRAYFVPNVPTLGKCNPCTIWIEYCRFLRYIAAKVPRFADLTNDKNSLLPQVAPFFSTTSKLGHHFAKTPAAIQKKVNDVFLEQMQSEVDISYVNLRAASATWLQARGDDYALAVAQGGWTSKLMAQSTYAPMSELAQAEQMHVYANMYNGTGIGCKLANKFLEAGFYTTHLHGKIDDIKSFCVEITSNWKFVLAALTLAAKEAQYADVVFERAQELFESVAFGLHFHAPSWAATTLQIKQKASLCKLLKEEARLQDATPDSTTKSAQKAALQLKNFVAMQVWSGPRVVLAKDPEAMVAKKNKAPTTAPVGTLSPGGAAASSSAATPAAAAASSSSAAAASSAPANNDQLEGAGDSSSDEDDQISEDELEADSDFEGAFAFAPLDAASTALAPLTSENGAAGATAE